MSITLVDLLSQTNLSLDPTRPLSMDPTSDLLSMTPNFIFNPWHAPHLMSCSQHSQFAFSHHVLLSWNSRHLQILLLSSVPSISLCSSTPLLPGFPSHGVEVPSLNSLTAPFPFMSQMSLRTCSLDPLHILITNVYYMILQSPAHSPLSPARPWACYDLSVIIAMVSGTQYTFNTYYGLKGRRDKYPLWVPVACHS